MLADMMRSVGKVSIQHVGPCGFQGPEGPENLGMKGCFVIHDPASSLQPSWETVEGDGNSPRRLTWSSPKGDQQTSLNGILFASKKSLLMEVAFFKGMNQVVFPFERSFPKFSFRFTVRPCRSDLVSISSSPLWFFSRLNCPSPW